MHCRSCGRSIDDGESVDNGICARCRRSGGSHRGVYLVGILLLLLGARLLATDGKAALVILACGFVAIVVAFGIVTALHFFNARSTPEDDRDEGAQIAGQTCAVCEEKILSVLVGAACAECAAPCHEECLGRHITSTHEGARTHPYRR